MPVGQNLQTVQAELVVAAAVAVQHTAAQVFVPVSAIEEEAR